MARLCPSILCDNSCGHLRRLSSYRLRYRSVSWRLQQRSLRRLPAYRLPYSFQQLRV
ncbi:hypothetical protein CGCA056_v011756 [Colletotrichum aenigma]|uniref:uncharacterized protein n=1 Tax=Colletotrichum aenigma TaxID=1215731 RepID=UPI00187320E9|nr:uncharacterized protein CGCA056_v011756 [Colletotrichum aenigma]KAF5512588.1 hypothetical protein CGCA056_v011756 [Colletotrichum aenigma]